MGSNLQWTTKQILKFKMFVVNKLKVPLLFFFSWWSWADQGFTKKILPLICNGRDGLEPSLLLFKLTVGFAIIGKEGWLSYCYSHKNKFKFSSKSKASFFQHKKSLHSYATPNFLQLFTRRGRIMQIPAAHIRRTSAGLTHAYTCFPIVNLSSLRWRCCRWENGAGNIPRERRRRERKWREIWIENKKSAGRRRRRFGG